MRFSRDLRSERLAVLTWPAVSMASRNPRRHGNEINIGPRPSLPAPVVGVSARSEGRGRLFQDGQWARRHTAQIT